MSEPKILEYDGREFTLLYADLVPPQNDEDLAALRESIRRRGVIHAVIHDKDDVVIDGGTRLRIAKEEGIPLAEIPTREFNADDEEKAEMLAVELNVARRQMTREGRVLIAHRLRKRGRSTRTIAEALRVDHKTVWNYLHEPDPEADSTGENSPTGRVVGANGKSYPATRPQQPDPDPVSGVQSWTPENIVGSDGKTYPASKPKPVVDSDDPADNDQPSGPDEGRKDVPSTEPTEDEPAPKPEPKGPPTEREIKRQFDRAFGVAQRAAAALGRYQAFKRQWNEIYNGTLDIKPNGKPGHGQRGHERPRVPNATVQGETQAARKTKAELNYEKDESCHDDVAGQDALRDEEPDEAGYNEVEL